MAKTAEELRTFDVFSASRSQLQDHISALRLELISQSQFVPLSMIETQSMMTLAVAQLNARSSDRTSKTALAISLLAFVVGLISLIVQFVSKHP